MTKKRASQRNKKNKKAQKLTKRWFVAASGWGLDLNMGSDVRQTTGSKSRRDVSLPVDSMVLISAFDTTAANFKHSTVYSYNMPSLIAQGTDEGNRIGSTIKIHSMGVRGSFSTNGSTNPNNCKSLRLLLIAYTKQASSSGSFLSGGGSPGSDIFYNNVGVCFGIVNPRVAKVLCDTVLTIQPTVASSVTSQYFDHSCTLNIPFEYQTGTIYGTAANLYWVLVPFEHGATIGTTQMGEILTEFSIAYGD